MFDSDHQYRAYMDLIQTSNHLRDISKSYFEDLGITEQQFNVLQILKDRHPKPTKAGAIKEENKLKQIEQARFALEFLAKKRHHHLQKKMMAMPSV